MSPHRIAFVLGIALWTGGCEQLGNPEQFATGPTPWKDQHGHLVTTTRSFKDEKTIRRLLADELEGVNYADPSIGPAQALTVVVVVPRALRPTRGRSLKIVTIFSFAGRPPITRRWTVPRDARKWSAAFALPDAPVDAISSVAP